MFGHGGKAGDSWLIMKLPSKMVTIWGFGHAKVDHSTIIPIGHIQGGQYSLENRLLTTAVSRLSDDRRWLMHGYTG